MRPGDLAPNASIVASVLLYLGFVNVGHALPSVPRNFFLGVYILNLDKRSIWVLI